MNKKWILNKKAPASFLKKFPEYPWVISQLLFSRKISTEKSMENFLSPEFLENLHNPLLMPGMKKGVNRIIKALKNKERILVYGDYDCDGITGTMILLETLNYLGAKNTGFYLPDRDKEGYGISDKGLKKILKEKYSLVITTDCGVANFKQITELVKNKVDVIVSDHHTIQKKVPPALAIIHPQFKNSKYPFADLSGAGVAFKIAQALLLNQKYPAKKSKTTRLTFLKWLLDLVAIGTVADCVDLVDENRVLVKYGLIVLNKTKRIGLNALFDKAKLTKGELGAYSIGFQIAPRLNAAGRMDHANSAFFLLETNSETTAKELADSLEKQNSKRQRIVEKMVAGAVKTLSGKKDFLLIAKKNSWRIGVAGLAASRVLEKLNKPTLICEQIGSEIKCSARSIPKFNIIKAITSCGDLLESFGGHAAAAGLSLNKKNWSSFKKKITSLANKQIKKSDLVAELKLEAKLKPVDITWELVEYIEKLAPFGMGNSKPKFWLRDFIVRDTRTVGKSNKHLKLSLSNQDKTQEFDAIGFGLGEAKIKAGDKVELAANLEFNEWQGRKKIQLSVIDIKPET